MKSRTFFILILFLCHHLHAKEDPILPGFETDQFTFVQLEFSGYWRPDYPGANNNLTERLRELTTLRVLPPKTVKVEDPELFEYPFLYLSSPADSRGEFKPTDDEVAILRQYLQNGGFMMVEETWGEAARIYFTRLMEQILPDVKPIEIGISHQIFQLPYNMEKISATLGKLPQMGSIDSVALDYSKTWESSSPATLAQEKVENLDTPHYYEYRVKGRPVMIWCHNNDLADGWEEEGNSNKEVFEKYSSQIAYPMVLNIIFFSLTK